MNLLRRTLIASYSDSFYWATDNLYKEPSKTLANANITWHSLDKKIEVGAFCNNLTNKGYDTHEAPFGSSGGWRVPGPPRMYGARVGYNF